MNGHITATVATPKPWETLGSVLGFTNEDQKFWWTYTAPVLGKFMAKADYNVAQQYSFLSWFHNFILPALGPSPAEGKERTWRAQCTPNASPFQPSWNIQNNKSTVRFTIEPISFNAGTREDVFNHAAGVDLVKKLSASMPDMETSWFDHCVKELYVSKDTINMILAVKGIPKAKPPTVFIAFDLLEKAIETKAYFFPHMRAFLMGVTQGELVINTVKGFNEEGIDMNPGLDAFEEYLRSGGSATHRNVEMLAIDCVEKSRARAKIYVNSFNNSYNKIKDIYTMGGRLNDKATVDSLEPLKDLWRLLYDMPETDFEDIEIPNIMHPRSCFVIGFEFKSGEPLPVAKIYFPMWHYAKNDNQISTALTAFFVKQKWQKMADSYTSDIADIL
jgi:DMATS type aromatic prenyltransferase